MFKLHSADVFYGMSRYPLNGLPDRYASLAGPDDLDPAALARDVGHLTGYPRDFDIRHNPRQSFDLGGPEPLVIDENICALANGYSIIWRKT